MNTPPLTELVRCTFVTLAGLFRVLPEYLIGSIPSFIYQLASIRASNSHQEVVWSPFCDLNKRFDLQIRDK